VRLKRTLAFRRVLTVLVAVLALTGVIFTASPASANAVLCSGNAYSVCTSMGYTDHSYGANNGTSYWGAVAGHNCTNYVAYVESTVNGAPSPGNNLGNAYQWASNATSKGIPVNGTPAKGAVAQWNAYAGGASSDGHVAYVESVNGDGSITISEDNYSGGPFTWRIISAGASNWPSNFIHFKDLSGSSGGGSAHRHSSDFNGDGYDDIAWQQGSTLYMLQANGNRQFGIAGYNAGFGPPDWVGAGKNGGLADVYYHQGSTIFDLEWAGTSWSIVNSTNGIGTPSFAAVGDFNCDGYDDIAWQQGSTLYMLQANGTGQFSVVGSSGGFGPPDWMATGRNGGSCADVYYHQGSTIFDLEWAGTSWSIVNSTNGIGTPGAAVVGDFNGDNYDDIAWQQGSTLYMLQANGTGQFSVVGSSGGIDTPDWAGGGVNNTTSKADVYWHQGSTIFDLEWAGTSWSIVNSTNGIGTPSFAASATS